MSQISESTIRTIVSEVLEKIGSGPAIVAPSTGKLGVFDDMNEAAKAARAAFEQLRTKGVAGRSKVIGIVKRLCYDNAKAWGRIEFEETKIGRLDHKIEKLLGIPKVPGAEWMHPLGMSGDAGITMEEFAPFGVIGVVSPVTHSIPTISSNIVNMVAAGNAVVVNAHPGGAKCAAMAIREFNKAIWQELGIENLISAVESPTLESFKQMCESDDVALLCITGGPGVVDAAMKTGKRAICAGPGNPPVVVDDCDALDFDRVARDVILGASYDNNLLCIGEKQVFVVAPVYDRFMDAMKRAGAVLLNPAQTDKVRTEVFDVKDGGGGCSHAVLNRAFVGADPAKLAAVAGVTVSPKTDLLITETGADDLFVQEEQMMPLLPIVRCSSFEDAVQRSLQSEHGYRHSAMIHTMNVSKMTRMGQVMDTTLFVKNGACVAGLGVGGEGYSSFSIATTTGEGITTPKTFTRFRRCVLVDQLNIAHGAG